MGETHKFICQITKMSLSGIIIIRNVIDFIQHRMSLFYVTVAKMHSTAVDKRTMII